MASVSVPERAAAFGFRLGWRVGFRVPERAARPLLDLVADRVWAKRGRNVIQLEHNLSRAAPAALGAELSELSRAAMRSYVRYWGEAFRLPRWSQREVAARVVLHDADRLFDAHAAGRGVVGALPHMGNWDLGGAWACASGLPLTTVAERLRPESLYADFVAYRASLGMEILALDDASTYRLLVERLRAGRFVPLLADRDLSRRGVVVPLLGEPAGLPGGPARLAQLTGATLLPITCDYGGPEGRDGRMHLRIHPPVPHTGGHDGTVAMTTAVADVFSTVIAAQPADWHMLQRVFVADVVDKSTRQRLERAS